MRKINVILTVTFLFIILSTKTHYAQSGTVNYSNNVIKFCNEKASFNVDFEILYNFSLPSSKWGTLKLTFKVTSVSNNINLNGKQVATSKINHFNDNFIRISQVYADVYSGTNRINNININVDGYTDFLLKGTSSPVMNSITWTEIFNTDNREEILKMYEQGITLKNFTFKTNYHGQDGFIATPKDACEQLRKLEVNDNYKTTIDEADNLLQAGQNEAAQKKYKEASRLKPSEQYPKEKISGIKKIQSQQNQVENTASEPETIDDSDNNSDETSYSSSTSNSSSEKSQYSNNSNNNQQVQNYQKTQAIINEVNRSNRQTESNVQATYQTTDKALALVDNIFAQQRAQQQYENEREQEREAERERERMEEARKEREIEMAWNTMTDFENGFNGYFNKNLTDVMAKESVYFYFGSIKKYKNDKSGNLKLSNVFPVYSYPDGTWPYMSDIINKIKTKHGDVVIRGYFLTETAAKNDKNNKVSKARNSYFNSINQKAYYFTFNEKVANSSKNSDFWGNEKSNNNNNTNKTQKDFWGNEKPASNENTTNKSNSSRTDFWGNDIEKKQVKTDSTKKKSDDDFWK